MQVSLIYTGVDLTTDEPTSLPPEVYATYDETTVDQLRDYTLRQMVIATMGDGIPRVNGVWSTVVA